VHTFPCINDPGLTLQIAEWSDSTDRIGAAPGSRLGTAAGRKTLIIKPTKKPVGLLGWFK
jgi:hypothetical protein